MLSIADFFFSFIILSSISVIDEKMRAQMSLDWIAREQHSPGIILQNLQQVNQEIEVARLNGQELRFLKEKRDILLLASYQFDMEVNA